MRFALVSFLAVGCLSQLAAVELMTDGGFAGSAPDVAWTTSAGSEIATDPANRCLHLEVTEPGKMVMAYQQVAVTAGKTLRLTFRARWKGVQRGSEAWFDARVMLDFKNHEQQKIGGAPNPPNYTGTSDGWRQVAVEMRVPDTAAFLEIMPCLLNAKAGSFDLDDVSLVEIEPTVPPAKPTVTEPAKPRVVDAGRTPPLALHVAGNRLLRSDGSEAWLQGACVDGMSWSNTGEDALNRVIAAMDDWKANSIRLPITDEFWFGRHAGQQDGGAAHRAIIRQCVTAASSRGAHIILDLHRFRAPTAEHVAFWKDVATTYKDDPAVIFELFNEPYDMTWEIWRDGGDMGNKNKVSTALIENKDEVKAFHTVGMQALVDAVRSTGAKNLILAGGLDWSYDDSGVINGFALKDQEGCNGIAYVAHVYPWKKGWQHAFLDVAKVYPIVVTEVGADVMRYEFIPPERHENPYTWGPDMIACIQKYHLHWTAFSFHPRCGPSLLMDTADGSFSPNPHWGAFAKAALSGAQFTSDRLR